MYQLSCDTFHNKLVITLHKSMSADDFAELEAQLKNVVPSMEPNFTVINDISRYQGVGMDKFPIVIFRRIALYLRSAGVGQIIRVVGASKVGLRDFSYGTRGIENYEVIHVPRLCDVPKIAPQLVD